REPLGGSTTSWVGFTGEVRKRTPPHGYKGAQTMDSSSFTSGSARHSRRLTLVIGLAVATFLLGVVPRPASAKRFHGKITSAASTDSVFDVQVIWDPTTSRFYYAADDVVSSSDNRVAFGFSKTASPSSSADFCNYTIGFGRTFPDYPKLGDSQFFAMIGSNLFNGGGS